MRRAAASGHKVLAMYPVILRAAASPGRYPGSPWRVYVLPTGEELHEVRFTDHRGCHATLLALLWGLLPRGFDSFGPDRNYESWAENFLKHTTILHMGANAELRLKPFNQSRHDDFYLQFGAMCDTPSALVGEWLEGLHPGKAPGLQQIEALSELHRVQVVIYEEQQDMKLHEVYSSRRSDSETGAPMRLLFNPSRPSEGRAPSFFLLQPDPHRACGGRLLEERYVQLDQAARVGVVPFSPSQRYSVIQFGLSVHDHNMNKQMLASRRGAGLPHVRHAPSSPAPPPLPWSGPEEEEVRALQTVMERLLEAQAAAAAPQWAAAVAAEEAALEDRARAAAEVAAALAGLNMQRDSDRGRRGAGRNEDPDWQGGSGYREVMPLSREEALGRCHNPRGQMGSGSHERPSRPLTRSAVVPVPPSMGRKSGKRRQRAQQGSAGLLDSGSEQHDSEAPATRSARRRPPESDLAAGRPRGGALTSPELERLERILRKRKSLAVREAVDLDAQALPPLLRQFRETLGQLPSLGTTSASVRSHLQNSNQLIVVLSEKNVGRLDETLIGYCFSEMVLMPDQQSGNAMRFGVKVWDLFIQANHRARKLSSFLLIKTLVLHGLKHEVAATLVTPPAIFLPNSSANKLYRSFGYRSVQGASTQLIDGVEQVKAAVASSLDWYETGGGRDWYERGGGRLAD